MKIHGMGTYDIGMLRAQKENYDLSNPNFRKVLGNLLKEKGGIGEKIDLAASQPNQEDLLKTKCQEFEAIFGAYMYKTLSEEELIKGYVNSNSGEQCFKSLLTSERANDLARKQPLGLGKILFDNLKKVLNKPQAGTGNSAGNNSGSAQGSQTTEPAAISQ